MTMTPYDKLKNVRQGRRPTGETFVEKMFTDRVELHGDRRFGDDPAIRGGVGFLGDMPVTYVAIEKGRDLESRMRTNFGCPKPEGYRKAMRLMKQAEKFRRPVVCFVDTSGAYPGAEAEERGQGQAIAESIQTMLGLRTPTVAVIIGEGGSGGALALAASDRVYMLENAVYSVISPEGCASILWKDSSRAGDAADCLRITAADMKTFGVAERVIPEDFGRFDQMCANLTQTLQTDLNALLALEPAALLEQRYGRFRKFGTYREDTAPRKK